MNKLKQAGVEEETPPGHVEAEKSNKNSSHFSGKESRFLIGAEIQFFRDTCALAADKDFWCFSKKWPSPIDMKQ